ncbi:hypothetical protein FHS14_002377 [Paenibacillus baekrokdamisoli]|uniref:hypothetical protein n=1 Tax=Paenibacillus baekrokdamisoli TaxID=1712516 RepID=UPI0017F27B44|nr:hypothetical protein [Paenibacillus baekrokdamisoli]MBB3069387.1 hypothetical protein [Paenibacillus baekrokdamisoli]
MGASVVACRQRNGAAGLLPAAAGSERADQRRINGVRTMAEGSGRGLEAIGSPSARWPLCRQAARIDAGGRHVW